MHHNVIPIALLDGHQRNYRSHPETQLRQLRASLERFSQVRSIVVQPKSDGRYTILAGHGVVEAARQCHYQEIRCDVVPAEWDQATCDAYLVADNLHAQNAVDDETLLAQLLVEQQDAGYDLASLGSDEETLRQMLDALGDEPAGYSAGDGEEDELPDEVETRCKPGDVWQLGRHVIACMDSTDPETLRTLCKETPINFVFSDPPYGISIVATNVSVGGGEAYDIPFGGVKNRRKGDVGGSASHMRKTGKSYLEEWNEKQNGAASKGLGSIGGAKPFGSRAVRGTDGAANVVDVGKYAPVIGDETTATAITAYRLCAQMFPKALQVWWGANYYANALPPSKCWIVWDKENTGNFADAELAWCSADRVVRIFRHMWNGMLKDSEHGKRRVHPTQKPVALAQWCFEELGKEQDVIFDPFLGSGITVMAAETMNRSVIGCELSPEYIDVIIKRWEDLTGEHATLLERCEEVTHG